jgi:hypothetical protein
MIECVVKIQTVPRQQVIQKAPTMMPAYATSFEQAGAGPLGDEADIALPPVLICEYTPQLKIGHHQS